MAKNKPKIKFYKAQEAKAQIALKTQHIQQKFLNAEPHIKEAFQIRSIDKDILFSWPCAVMKCVKSV